MTRLESESVSGRAAATGEDDEDEDTSGWRGGMYGGGGARGTCCATTALGFWQGDGDEVRECERDACDCDCVPALKP